MKTALFLTITLAFAANFLFLGHYLLSRARRLGWLKALGAAAVFFVLSFAMLRASASLPLRGGYDNEHDFGYASMEFFGINAGEGFAVEKEVGATAGFGLADALSGHSIAGLETANRLLWPVCGGLVFLFLLELGAGVAGAALGAGLFAFSFLFALNAASMATTCWNVFYLLCALLPLAVLGGEGPSAWVLYWCMSVFCLVASSRYEFLPALAPGAVYAALAARGRAGRWAGALLRALPGFLLCAAACFCWIRVMGPTQHYNGPRMLRPFYILQQQLGVQNLSLVLPFPGTVWALSFLLLGGYALWRAKRERDGNWRLAVGWLALWTAYFCVIFDPLGRYPLHFMRHNLYFFLPVCLVAGAALKSPASGSPRSAGLRLAGVLALLCVYAPLNLRAAHKLDGELRTNDREWQFLAAARKNWPDGAKAVYNYGDTRRDLLRKYFPFDDEPLKAASGTLLLYRSPMHDALVWNSDFFNNISQHVPDKEFDAVFKPDLAHPQSEVTFTHRPYTIWGNDKHAPAAETQEPVTLKAGFYPVTKTGK